jgi:hypothetical protein
MFVLRMLIAQDRVAHRSPSNQIACFFFNALVCVCVFSFPSQLCRKCLNFAIVFLLLALFACDVVTELLVVALSGSPCRCSFQFSVATARRQCLSQSRTSCALVCQCLHNRPKFGMLHPPRLLSNFLQLVQIRWTTVPIRVSPSVHAAGVPP